MCRSSFQNQVGSSTEAAVRPMTCARLGKATRGSGAHVQHPAAVAKVAKSSIVRIGRAGQNAAHGRVVVTGADTAAPQSYRGWSLAQKPQLASRDRASRPV